MSRRGRPRVWTVPTWRPARAGARMLIANLPRWVERVRLTSPASDAMTRSLGRNPRPRKRIAAPGNADSGFHRIRAPVDEATSPRFPGPRTFFSLNRLATRLLPPTETSRRSSNRLGGTRTLVVNRPRRPALRTARRRRPVSTVTRRLAGKPRPVSFATVPGAPAAGRSITWLCVAASESPAGTSARAATPTMSSLRGPTPIVAPPAATSRIGAGLQRERTARPQAATTARASLVARPGQDRPPRASPTHPAPAGARAVRGADRPEGG
jgi:hypothetical protein